MFHDDEMMMRMMGFGMGPMHHGGMSRRMGWVCDRCGLTNAASDVDACRYKCRVCDDFDLCQNCYENPSGFDGNGRPVKQHVAAHSFTQSGKSRGGDARRTFIAGMDKYTDDSELPSGTKVVLRGLKRNPEHNGTQGVVVSCSYEGEEKVYEVDVGRLILRVPERFVHELKPEAVKRPFSRRKSAPTTPGSIGEIKPVNGEDMLGQLLRRSTAPSSASSPTGVPHAGCSSPSSSRSASARPRSPSPSSTQISE